MEKCLVLLLLLSTVARSLQHEEHFQVEVDEQGTVPEQQKEQDSSPQVEIPVNEEATSSVPLPEEKFNAAFEDVMAEAASTEPEPVEAETQQQDDSTAMPDVIDGVNQPTAVEGDEESIVDLETSSFEAQEIVEEFVDNPVPAGELHEATIIEGSKVQGEESIGSGAPEEEPALTENNEQGEVPDDSEEMVEPTEFVPAEETPAPEEPAQLDEPVNQKKFYNLKNLHNLKKLYNLKNHYKLKNLGKQKNLHNLKNLFNQRSLYKLKSFRKLKNLGNLKNL